MVVNLPLPLRPLLSLHISYRARALSLTRILAPSMILAARAALALTHRGTIMDTPKIPIDIPKMPAALVPPLVQPTTSSSNSLHRNSNITNSITRVSNNTSSIIINSMPMEALVRVQNMVRITALRHPHSSFDSRNNSSNNNNNNSSNNSNNNSNNSNNNSSSRSSKNSRQ